MRNAHKILVAKHEENKEGKDTNWDMKCIQRIYRTGSNGMLLST
jgi:hypothetical protein